MSEKKLGESMKKRPTDKELLTKKDNFIEIQFGYSNKYVLPHSDGIKFMEALRNAEQKITCPSGIYAEYIIVPIDDKPTSQIISQKEYLDMKMAHLLGVTVKELNAEPNPPDTKTS